MEQIIQNDPTLKMMIESEIDPKLFDWHITLKCTAIKIALNKYLDWKYGHLFRQ